MVRIVGDNIDHEMHARIQSSGHGNQSLHWTHQYAIRDSVVNPLLDSTKPQQSVNQLPLISLLPTPDVQERLKATWKVLVSRVVTKYLSEFKFLRKAVIHHIPHPFVKEMSQKSEIVSIYCIHAAQIH